MWNAGSEKLFGYTAEEAMGRNIVELLCCQQTSHAASQIIARLQVGQCWTGNFSLIKKSGEVFDAMITDRPIFDGKGNVSMIVGVASDSRPFKEQIRALIGSCSSSMHISTIPSPTAAEDDQEQQQLTAILKPLQLNMTTTTPLRPVRTAEIAAGNTPSLLAPVTSRPATARLLARSQSRTAPLRVPSVPCTDEVDNMTVPLADLVARGTRGLDSHGGTEDGGDAAAMAFDFPKGEAAVPFDFSAEGGPGEGEAALPFEFEAEGEGAAHAELQHPWQIPFASTVLSLAGRVAQSIGQVRKRLSPTSSTVSSQIHLAEPMLQQHLPLPLPAAAPAAPAASGAVADASLSEARLPQASVAASRLGGGVQRRGVQGGRSPKASRLTSIHLTAARLSFPSYSFLLVRPSFYSLFAFSVWQDVAVKVFARHDISADFMRDFKKEIRIMEKLRHPNILLFMGAVASLDHLAIVTEFLPRGSLFRLLHRRTAGLTRLRLLRMALDVARGVNYLHKCSPPVVHHDLKSANLLVDRNWTVKVGDFGLSKMKFATYLSARSGRGTPQWMAPEVLRNEPSNEKSDVYSFGVVLWEMATRQVPWDGMNPMQVVGAVGFLEQQLPLPPSIDPAMRLLISDCWRSPMERPSFDEITSRLKIMVQEQEQQQVDGRHV
ncbi:unnamed protein product [Closterium sp. Yama58-4]|nr:unnamed protein product [Closterium sp. Yama58-4]